ncbi:MAG: hypothetical protein FWK04_13190 [Nostoc sp. GBBB01]|nr:hypothetical protein [Nostoc sp. GBBB01]
MPLDHPWCFCIHSSGIDVAKCQIVNTPSKAAKDFYSRIERLIVSYRFVFLEFKPFGSHRCNHSCDAAMKIQSEASHPQKFTS